MAAGRPSTAVEPVGQSPLSAAIDASAWTRADVELMADLLMTAAMLAVAVVALMED